ncbi:DUF3025 domain-containing protein [Noviherbaspirillum sp. UKPF54]|uniref:DUF3025 domain-containing protein n=1 Tax=Noviherbaspirillum sp. UKPF54 TaxID=2601898 RepID=UPI0011B15E81|nr:DUF3025 domain-containing protein [Noviherbaspirillum sp. UKPF54]QDZ30291.1 DUF3025 domain-containing protein [Noviherbaspirillum sp. UKPF54]
MRFFDAIDWQRPWLAPLRATAESIVHSPDWRAAINHRAEQIGLKNHRGLPIRFVPQASLPHGMAYEAFISATGGVPTRENLHDFFNALVWLTFPRIKVQLNALQAAEIVKAGAIPASRGKVRDAATIFDENAALLVVRDASLIDALRAHAWHEVFIERRHEFAQSCDVWLFGHALMEKLVSPYKAITAHARPVIAENAYFGLSPCDKRIWIDEAVKNQLGAGLTTAEFTPLPVLGIPGWWDGQGQEFYDDAAVFRPKRQGKTITA